MAMPDRHYLEVLAVNMPGDGTAKFFHYLRFETPARRRAAIKTLAEVTEIFQEKCRMLFKTICTVANSLLLEADSTIMVSPRTRLG